MRPIPAALRTKLLNRFKADSTGSAPAIRLVATQTSTNTFLTEAIHENEPAAMGDIAIRQLEGETSPSLAYAICLDQGIAKIYRRLFPANMNFVWDNLWTYGPAADVAIEFNGEWTLDASHQWYYMQTEQYPYIFVVEQGVLYVQHWNDGDTKVQLDSGVSQISACRGWKNSIDTSLDQGLIVAYLKSGAVYYRALCIQEDGSLLWEAPHQITTLGTGNTTITVFRTNDFRVGFLTENDGDIKLALSSRTYAGMSVRPETIHVNAVPSASLLHLVRKYGYVRENMAVSIGNAYFNFDTSPATSEITVLSAETLNREETFYSYACKLYLDHALYGTIDQKLINGSKISVNNGSTTTTVYISSIEYDDTDQALILCYASDIKRTNNLTITTVGTYSLSYARVCGQRWPLPALTATIAGQTIQKYGYDNNETITAQPVPAFTLASVITKTGYATESLVVEAEPTVTLAAVSDLPI